MKKILIFSTIILFSSLSIAKNKDQLKRKGNLFSFLFYNTPQLESEDSSSNTLLRNVLISKIISEPEGGIVHEFLLELDENDHIVNILRKNGGDLQRISIIDVINKEVVLAETSGRKALLISCKNCTVNQGGEINLKYLNNGISMTYKNFKMNIVYRDNNWFLTTLDNQRIDSLRLVSRKIVGRIIGIAEIKVNS